MSDYYPFPEYIGGLTREEHEQLGRLYRVWLSKKDRNALKVKYYNMKNGLKDLNISIPPPLRNVETVVGWPAKAVDLLADRSIFDGFTFADGSSNSGLDAVLAENDFKVTYDQGVRSELINSCAFVTCSKGKADEPSALVTVHSALTAAAVWNWRKRRIAYGMTIVDFDEEHPDLPSWVNLYTDDAVVEIRKSSADVWRVARMPHSHGRPLMEALVNKPSLDRPFGKSRISRAVMSITDSAVREALRTEIASEFFTSPQKYLLGADETVFNDSSKWEAYLGSIFAITTNENGEIPHFGQLAQMSMQPHTDYMRSLAARFSGETNIPISSLGVIHDNPASAEAIYAAKEDLIIEANHLNETNGRALNNIGRLLIAIIEDKSLGELTDNEKTVSARFKNPAMPSVVSSADAMVKQVSILPWLAETTVVLQELGYTDEQIKILLNEKRQAQGRQTLASLFATGENNGNNEETA